MEKQKTDKNAFTLSWTVASLIQGINLKLGWEGKGHEVNGQKSAAVPEAVMLSFYFITHVENLSSREQ